jgi:hypothetical protein
MSLVSWSAMAVISRVHSLAEMSMGRKWAYVILTNGENGWKLIQEIAPDLARRFTFRADLCLIHFSGSTSRSCSGVALGLDHTL